MVCDQRFYIIYKTTNLITNQYYIGMHSTHQLNDGYLGSGTKLKESVNEYGEENHTREILDMCSSKEQMKMRERSIVNDELLLDDMCLNLRRGGKGGFTREQQQENNRRSLIAQQKLRETDPEWVNQKAHKQSEANRRAYKKGRKICTTPHVTGEYKHSDNTRDKISKAAKGKSTGSSNSQYNTCWVYHPDQKTNQKVKKEELEQWVLLGWILGRKMRFV